MVRRLHKKFKDVHQQFGRINILINFLPFKLISLAQVITRIPENFSSLHF